MTQKTRLDDTLVAAGLAPNKSQAKGLILAGQVTVDGKVVDKAGTLVSPTAQCALRRSGPSYVSRGGHKLAGALEHFPYDVAHHVALDIGASTGGFTDCLLQRGARRVYAVDVGYGQLDWKLRNDPRVIVFERTNFRHLAPGTLDPPPTLVVADLSFISLEKILAPLRDHLPDRADCIVLIKPQFEVGPAKVGSGGVVRDQGVRLEAIDQVLARAQDLDFQVVDHVDSVLPGPKGNLEHFAWLRWDKSAP